jgi:hypothetical protein
MIINRILRRSTALTKKTRYFWKSRKVNRSYVFNTSYGNNKNAWAHIQNHSVSYDKKNNGSTLESMMKDLVKQQKDKDMEHAITVQVETYKLINEIKNEIKDVVKQQELMVKQQEHLNKKIQRYEHEIAKQQENTNKRFDPIQDTIESSVGSSNTSTNYIRKGGTDKKEDSNKNLEVQEKNIPSMLNTVVDWCYHLATAVMCIPPFFCAIFTLLFIKAKFFP